MDEMAELDVLMEVGRWGEKAYPLGGACPGCAIAVRNEFGYCNCIEGATSGDVRCSTSTVEC